MGFGFSNPFAPFYLQELGVTDPEALRIWTGLFLSASALSMIIVTPIWGYLADRVGRKPMSMRAALGGSLAFIGMALAQTPHTLIIVRIIQGIFTGTTTANLTLVITKTPANRKGLAIGAMNAAIFVGSTVGPLIGGTLADLIGYRGSLYVASVLLLVSFFIVSLFVKENFKPGPKIPFSFFKDTKQILSGTGLLSIVGLIALFGFSRTMQRPVIPLLVQEMSTGDFGLATQAGLVSSISGVAAVIAGIIAGNLADRGPLLKIGYICSALGAVTLIPMLFVDRVWQLALLYFAPHFFLGAIDPVLKVMVTRYVSEAKQGASFGIVGSAQSLGWGSGALMGGIFAAFLGLRSVFMIGCGLSIVISVILYFLGKKEAPRS
jgi:DHA1 family multidrug resistance protein-like MFS transporter